MPFLSVRVARLKTVSRLMSLATVMLATLAMTPSGRAQESAALDDLEERAFREAAAVAANSVVRIETQGGLDVVGELAAGSGPTSGVVVGQDGWIISSSFNFTNRPTSIVVTLADGRRFAAQRIAEDTSRHLTLLKIEATGLEEPQAVPEREIRVGQWAIAIGRTFDVATPNISVGIVSAVKRIWGKAIQTDAKVSPVNYGGALVDIQGRVLGVLAPLSPQGGDETAGAEWYDSGIGFAIPLESVLRGLGRLQTGTDLHAGLMGIGFRGEQSPTDQLLIETIRDRSPAAAAEIKPGDKVIAIEGQSITRYSELRQLLGSRYAGETVKVDVERVGEKRQVELTLVAELPAYEAPSLGILPSRTDSAEPGVNVRFVDSGGPAAKAGIVPGDRIVKCGDTAVTNVVELRSALAGFTPNDAVTLGVQRDKETIDVEVTLGRLMSDVPAELSSEAGSENPAKAPEGTEVGLLSAAPPGHERKYSAYVPEDYSPDRHYALVVYLASGNDGLPARFANAWKPVADQRSFILLGIPSGPRGWQPDDAEYVRDCVTQMTEKYRIDADRVVLHVDGEEAAQMGWTLAFRERTRFPGVAMLSTLIPQKVPENLPSPRQQFYLGWSLDDPRALRARDALKAFEKARLPVTVDERPEAEKKGSDEAGRDRLGRWIDSLDRI